MMKKILVCGTVCAVLIISFYNTAHVAYAETYVDEMFIGVDTVWSKAGSPYIVRGPITVTQGTMLTIESGVEVRGDLIDVDSPPTLFIEGGSLRVLGKSHDGQVVLRDLESIYVLEGTANIQNASMIGFGGFEFEKSQVTISTTTISDTYTAIRIKESDVSIRDSRIQHNTEGIMIEPEGMPVLMYSSPNNHIGGLGNAFDEGVGNTKLRIIHSIIDTNEQYAIRNFGTSTVEAQNNWWGSATGPHAQGVNNVFGLVDYDPWLTSEPELMPQQEAVCCSSILFIPGLQASNLFMDTKIIGGNSTNTLWEPNRNGDIKKLFLNPDGSSVDQSIYSGGAIDTAFGVVGVYKKFMKSLDVLKIQGHIQEWSVFGYDWRKSIPEVVAGPEKKATTTESLISTVESMAARSPTGKITLIAHSNGGLVAKYLVKVLADMGKTNLIDSVISVAVPYLGTPEALSALLHGDNQAMLGGLIVNQSHVRELGKNMASAYSLLPSEGFFKKVLSPTIAFASTTIPNLTNSSYPVNINSIEQQNNFVSDTKNERPVPVFNDIDSPLKGNEMLVAAAGVLHGILDPFVWPRTIARWAIAGWNEATTKSLEYAGKQICSRGLWRSKCTNEIVHSVTKTSMGDGTVVVPSASHEAGPTISLDLKKVAKDEDTEIIHRNILEASSAQGVIRKIVTGGHSGEGSFSLPPGASWDEPDYANEPDFLVLSTYSPVELHVYDTKGNHTGIIPKPSALADNDFVTGMYEEKVEGSDFESSGSDGDRDTYINIPFKATEKYDVVIKGTDFGLFTFQVEAFRAGVSTGKIEYNSIPVTPFMVATTTVADISPIPLNVDFDGDGSADVAARVGEQVDPYLEAEAMKKVIRAILGSDSRAQKLIKRIDAIVDMLKQGRELKAKNKVEKLKWTWGHKKFKSVSATDRLQIIKIIEQLVEFE